MNFDIWRLIIKAVGVTAIIGMVIFVIGLVGDPKIIKKRQNWKKLGLILIGGSVLVGILQVIITYFLLLKS